MRDELIVKNKPKANFSEEIRTIRTNLQFTSLDGDCKSFLVTSSIPSEGKTFICSNLAVSLAQIGKKTIIIDSDLRLGRLHNVFNVSNSKGFSNLLVSAELKNLDEYIKRTDVHDLYVLPRGTVPPNPSELLGSKNFKLIIQLLKKAFDYIIFDGTPIIGLPDSLVIATAVDRVILVTKEGYTSIDDLNESKKALEKVNANIAGIIVNNIKEKKSSKYSHYYGE